MNESDNSRGYVPLGVWAFWTIVGTAIVIGIAACLLRDSPDRYSYIQTVVLALTLVVVAVYTYLTRQMQKAMLRQTNVSILPIFEVMIRLEGDYEPDASIPGAIVSESRVELKNIGQGVALNIEIDPLMVNHGSSYGELSFLGEPLWFEKIVSLSPRQKIYVTNIQRHDRDKLRAANLPRRDLLVHLVGPKAYDDYNLALSTGQKMIFEPA